MDAVVIAILSVFAVYGVLALIKEICSLLLSNTGDLDRIVIYLKSDAERLENAARTLMLKNPTAEIVIIPKDKSTEIREIADKLSRDFACIHIGRLETKLSDKD
ncbi:MAG: hypothetical protein KIG65_04455 [Eubacteriales bacterium]|nr:hypothetical protein [Eubacteriales bacterium]